MCVVLIDEKTIYAHPCTNVTVICPVGTELPSAEDWPFTKGWKEEFHGSEGRIRCEWSRWTRVIEAIVRN
jgi:hypothetical protein